MTFSDFHLYLVLAAPYSVITFALIWLAMRSGSNWTLDVGGVRLTAGVLAAILGTSTLVSLMNGFIYMNSPSTYWENEVLPLDTIGVMLYSAIAVHVSFAICSFLKANIKPASSITA